MDAVFLKLLNMSLTASWLCLAVLILRLLLKRAPKAISCALWALVGLRLLFPFSLESVLSLIPSAEPLPEDMLLSPTPTINSGIPVINEVVNPVISGSLAPTPGASVNPMQVITTVAGYVWVIGMIAMLVYMLASYLRVKSKVAEAAKIEGNVYECDGINTPFILGVIRPRIYLPSSMNEADRAFVIAHEQAHLRRLDHLWKPLGFVLLTVYWFNPLLWLGYILLCRDIELACDEKVIRQLGTDVKKQYSEALINCSVPRRAISACPLAFGEVGVKGRIKSVLNYKKPAFWIILVAVVALVVTGVCFLTDPPASKDNDPADIDHPLYEDLGTSVLHDIDNDGVMDYCTIGPGPTSGVFTFTLTVTDENKSTTKYINIFYHDPCSLSFVRNESGAVYLRAEDFSPTSQADTHYYDIGIEGYLIVLSENGKKLDSLSRIHTIQYPYSAWNFATTPEFTLSEFEDTKFVFNGAIHMIDRAGKETELISGMPILKAGFVDLNGDGSPEFLGQANMGSGYIHSFIVVYDIRNDRFYRLDDRFSYDFYLTNENNTLSITIHDVRSSPIAKYNAIPVLVNRGDGYALELRNGSDVLYRSFTDGTHECFLPKAIDSYIFRQDNHWYNDSIVSLYEDQTFQFAISRSLSYLGYGKYEIKDGRLILSTDDGKYTYVFEMREDKLIYLGSEGTGYNDMRAFNAGSEFIKQNTN